MNKYIYLILLLFTSCSINNLTYYNANLIHNNRLFHQNNVNEITDLEGTMWVPSIPDTDILSSNDCYAFFENYVITIRLWVEDIIPDYPETCIYKYNFQFYKIMWIDKINIINNKQMEIQYGTISFTIENNKLIVLYKIDTDDYISREYQLHSIFDTIPYWEREDVEPVVPEN